MRNLREKKICAVLRCCDENLNFFCVVKIFKFNKLKCCFCKIKLFDDEKKTLCYVADEKKNYERVFQKSFIKIISQSFNAKKQKKIFS